MPKVIEPLVFDTKIFGKSVGRIDLIEDDIRTLNTEFPTLEDVLQRAHSSGFKIIYLLAPIRASASCSIEQRYDSDVFFPGKLVDDKTVYSMKLDSIDYALTCKRAFSTKTYEIKQYHHLNCNDDLSPKLLELAVASGSSSRFKVDERIPEEGFREMFKCWLRNSVKNNLADIIFVAYDKSSKEEIGFITLKKKGSLINIGLLAVCEKHRRQGIAFSLLSRAVLYAMESFGESFNDSYLQVITQSANSNACACYEKFGFEVQSKQEIYHIHLPDDLRQYQRISVADQQQTIPFCRQFFTGAEMTHISQLLDSCNIDSAAHYNLSCQAKLKATLGEDCSRVLLVPSGTAALELAALLCELQPGDEVIMPSYTFSSTANAFVLRGAVPVFVDVKEEDLNIDETRIERAITARTRVICVVHYGGVPCEMDRICAIAKKHQLLVVEDAAQAYLSKYKGKPLGTIGDFGCFSFHYTKNIVCGEGGALSVNRNEELARRAMVICEKGTNRHDFLMGKISKYEWVDLGSSFVISELLCAVLYAQLEAAEEITARRLQHYAHYRSAFQAMLAQLSAEETHFSIAQLAGDAQSNGHIFFLLFDTATNRERVQDALQRHGISSFTHYIPLHSSPAGIKYGKLAEGEDMRVTDRARDCLLRLPMWTELTDDQLDKIIHVVQQAMNLLD